MIAVVLTRLAAAQRDALRATSRKRYDAWLARLEHEGCKVLDYRLTGEVVERFCVSHLHGNLRVVVAFET